MRTDMQTKTDDFDAPDDLDRLMTRLESPAPPRSLAPAILAATTRHDAARPRGGPVRGAAGGGSVLSRARAALWGAYAALLLLVAGGAVLLGGALHGGGTLDYLAFALSDGDLLRQSPELFRDALLETMPWGHLAALGVTLAAWAAVAIALLRRGIGGGARGAGDAAGVGG